MVITDSEIIQVHIGDPNVIENSRGNTWPRDGRNIQAAIDDLGGMGDIYLPQTTDLPNGLDVPIRLLIPYNGIKIHGWGVNKTKLNFTSNSHGTECGMMVSQNPGTSESNMRWGIEDFQLDNFSFTGRNLWLVIRKNGLFYNLYGEDSTASTAAVRFICPYGVDTNGDGWTDSPDAKTENLQIINCHTNRTKSHGFQLNAVQLKGCEYNNILFKNCSALKAGCHEWPSHGWWSVGFDFAEKYGSPHEEEELILKNLLVDQCEAYESWESGFHFEGRPKKQNIEFRDCIANNNGMKYLMTDPDTTWDCHLITNRNECNEYPMDYCYWHSIGYTGCHCWSSNPFGAGFFGLNNAMTLINCISNGNGAWGYRCASTSSSPTFINCECDEYPTNSEGNGRGTILYGYPGGKCRRCAECPN